MTKSRDEIETDINAHAWKDPKFKEKLLKNPKEALIEFGIKVPDQAKVHVNEEQGNDWYLTLRKSPPNSKNLSEEELRKVAGAGAPPPKKCCS